MKAYKAFDKNLQCRGFQYEVGKTYETDEADICSTGFHACEMPLDVMQYYNDRFCEVELDANDQTDSDTKRVGKKIEIKAELSLAQLIKAQFVYVNEKVEAAQDAAKTDKNVETAATSGDNSTAAASGNCSTAATSGYCSTAATSGYSSTAATSGYGSTAAASGNCSTAATSGYGSTAATSGDNSTAATSGNFSTAAASGYINTAATSGDSSTAATSGDWSTAATSGNWSTAATSGDWSTAATSGYSSTAATSGKDSVAVAWGYKSKAKGAIGSYIVLSEFSDNGDLLNARMAKVDGEAIKADTFYMLKDGEFVEVVNGDA